MLNSICLLCTLRVVLVILIKVLKSYNNLLSKVSSTFSREMRLRHHLNDVYYFNLRYCCYQRDCLLSTNVFDCFLYFESSEMQYRYQIIISQGQTYFIAKQCARLLAAATAFANFFIVTFFYCYTENEMKLKSRLSWLARVRKRLKRGQTRFQQRKNNVDACWV